MVLLFLGLSDPAELLVQLQQVFLGEFGVHHAACHGQQTQHSKAAHHGHHFGGHFKAHRLCLFTLLLATQHLAHQACEDQLAPERAALEKEKAALEKEKQKLAEQEEKRKQKEEEKKQREKEKKEDAERKKAQRRREKIETKLINTGAQILKRGIMKTLNW